jgi:hypothetical protein
MVSLFHERHGLLEKRDCLVQASRMLISVREARHGDERADVFQTARLFKERARSLELGDLLEVLTTVCIAQSQCVARFHSRLLGKRVGDARFRGIDDLGQRRIAAQTAVLPGRPHRGEDLLAKKRDDAL